MKTPAVRPGETYHKFPKWRAQNPDGGFDLLFAAVACLVFFAAMVGLFYFLVYVY